MMKVAVIGAGAAGFFAALSVRQHHPQSEVTIFEKSNKLLSKVKISGGGRCNVTNACFNVADLVLNYPRGGMQLKKAFPVFNVKDTIEWFESRGVKLKTEPDNRMFPVTDNSQSVVDCLLNEAERMKIKIQINRPIVSIQKKEDRFILKLNNDDALHADKIIVATGGSPKKESYEWLKELGHEIIPPVPSLFTFNIPGSKITKLMGVSSEHALVRIQGTKLKQEGPLLITHWGMSGPAVLKLSAFGAKILNEMNYHFKINVNWNATTNEQALREIIQHELKNISRKKISNHKLINLPSRLWNFLTVKSEINPEVNWGVSKEKMNKLINTLTNDEYEIKGKTTFKEEFVTCGGVSLQTIDFSTMQSKVCSGMYFAGEVMDIDGITGGFNFQAAWTTGFIAGKLK